MNNAAVFPRINSNSYLQKHVYKDDRKDDQKLTMLLEVNDYGGKHKPK